MDLSLLQKVNELKEQGRSADDIKHELQAEGNAPDTVDAVLAESGLSTNQNSETAQAPTMNHHKVIQPTPGFDPNDHRTAP
jgi:hypothetical protein